MDVLSEVLSWLRVEGTRSRRSELSAPWGMAFSPVDQASFLVVEAGACHLLLEGGEPVALEAGDLVMFSPGVRVCLVDHPATPAVPYAEVLRDHGPAPQDRYARDYEDYPTLRYGGGGRRTVIRGWGLRFDGYEHHPLLAMLPPVMHVPYERRSALPWLETTLRFLLRETHEPRDGSDMISLRLVDLLFVQLLRVWFAERPAGEAGLLGALQDSSIRHALRLMHRYPADPWTVQRLAETIGMSRSNFSLRFQAMVGTPPLKYLTQVRMLLAANTLEADPHIALAEVASQVGYDSESSFGRAFKRTFRESPGAFRKRHRRKTPSTPASRRA